MLSRFSDCSDCMESSTSNMSNEPELNDSQSTSTGDMENGRNDDQEINDANEQETIGGEEQTSNVQSELIDNGTGEQSDSLDDSMAGNGHNEDVKIVVCELLCYMNFHQHTGMPSNMKKIVQASFTDEQIEDAKRLLWKSVPPGILKAYTQRRTTSTRSQSEANYADIFEALTDMDRKGYIGINFAGVNLSDIPKLAPEDLNDISMAERLSQVEQQLKMMQESCSSNTAAMCKLQETNIKNNSDIESCKILIQEISAQARKCEGACNKEESPLSPQGNGNSEDEETLNSVNTERTVQPDGSRHQNEDVNNSGIEVICGAGYEQEESGGELGDRDPTQPPHEITSEVPRNASSTSTLRRQSAGGCDCSNRTQRANNNGNMQGYIGGASQSRGFHSNSGGPGKRARQPSGFNNSGNRTNGSSNSFVGQRPHRLGGNRQAGQLESSQTRPKYLGQPRSGVGSHGGPSVGKTVQGTMSGGLGSWPKPTSHNDSRVGAHRDGHVPSKHRIDSEGFVTPRYSWQKNQRVKSHRQSQVFIYNVFRKYTVDNVYDHLSEYDIPVVDLYQRSHPNAKKKSFVLTVDESMFTRVMSESVWPVGINVREYLDRDQVQMS